jgi:hypothetical protein
MKTGKETYTQPLKRGLMAYFALFKPKWWWHLARSFNPNKSSRPKLEVEVEYEGKLDTMQSSSQLIRVRFKEKGQKPSLLIEATGEEVDKLYFK